MSALAERALDPLDAARRALLQSLSRTPLRPVLVKRELRVPVLLTAHAALGFALALFAPVLSLVIAPLVLGVPHVAADVRYLVLRRELPRGSHAAIALFAGALVAVRALAEWGPRSIASLAAEHALGGAWLLLAAVAGTMLAGVRGRSLLALAGALAVAVVAWREPLAFRLVLVHAHNLIAIGLWLALFRRNRRLAMLPLAVVLAGALVLASGVLLPVTLRHGMLELAGLHLFAAADWLAPSLGGTAGISLTIAFAFLQSVHYAIWLIAIPQDGARANATGFRQAYRGLERDFGRLGLAVVLGLTLLVAALGACSPVATRNLYLSLATFHSWLELAMLAFFVASGQARPALAR